MLSVGRLARELALRNGLAHPQCLCRLFASKKVTSTVVSPEMGNATKGKELSRPENLQNREITEREPYHAATPGDLRSTSGNGFGDGLFSHTSKWLQVNHIIFSLRLLSLCGDRLESLYQVCCN